MHYDRTVFQSLAMVGQFGFHILVPIGLCSFLGLCLDRSLGTAFFVIILFFVGAIAGFWNVYRFSKKIFDKQSNVEAYLHQGRKKHEADHSKDESDRI